jgi:hypothetical protein
MTENLIGDPFVRGIRSGFLFRCQDRGSHRMDDAGDEGAVQVNRAGLLQPFRLEDNSSGTMQGQRSIDEPVAIQSS